MMSWRKLTAELCLKIKKGFPLDGSKKGGTHRGSGIFEAGAESTWWRLLLGELQAALVIAE